MNRDVRDEKMAAFSRGNERKAALSGSEESVGKRV